MKHDVPDWVMTLINAMPIVIIVAIWVFMIIRVKKRGGQKVIKEAFSPKRMIRNLIPDSSVRPHDARARGRFAEFRIRPTRSPN